jgi:hypothetical protein
VNTSRYAKSAQLTWSSGSGRVVTYLAIRILPLGESVAGTTVAQVRANEVDRLDLIANRTLGDPSQAWRIADANDAINPFALCDRAGLLLNLPASNL